MSNSLNGDLSVRTFEQSAAMNWSSSPSSTVWRKRLHLVGPAEAGQVTSVVRYDKDSAFPSHEHPDGEEIFVLEGVFSDEHGGWSAGSYLLNPEGVSHAPFSKPGSVVFVKLRQYPGKTRRHVMLNTHELAWLATNHPGIEEKLLYRQDGFADITSLQRWNRDINELAVGYPEGAKLFVLAGSFEDELRKYESGDWIRLPAGFTHMPRTEDGCEVYLKKAGHVYMEQGL